MHRNSLIVILFILATIFTACAPAQEPITPTATPQPTNTPAPTNTPTPTATPEYANIAGTYTGLYAWMQHTDIGVTFVLEQDGNVLSGTFSVPQVGSEGTISGIVGIDSFTATFTQTAPCPGTFEGSGTIDGDTLFGEYTGNNCGVEGTGSFNVTKQ